MAFEMDGEFVLPASRAQVWRALNDPAVLCACLQGCQKMERNGENGFVATVKMKVGPVSSTFNGKVDLLDLDPPNSYRIEGTGEGGAAGFAKGGARVMLSDVEGGTLLRYNVDAEIGGRLAQLGGRLINGVARKQADQFFEAFAERFRNGDVPDQDQPAIGTPADAAAPVAAPVAIAPPPIAPPLTAPLPLASPAPWAWLFALGVAVLAGFLLGRSNVADLGVVAMIALALVSAGAGYRAGRP